MSHVPILSPHPYCPHGAVTSHKIFLGLMFSQHPTDGQTDQTAVFASLNDIKWEVTAPWMMSLHPS